MRKYILFYILFLFIIFTCSKNEDKEDIRSLKWTQDTINVKIRGDLKHVKFIWGSSLTDVYIGGYTTASHSNEPYGYFLLHYDGSVWNKIDLYSDIKIKPVSIYSISGTSGDNVYILGKTRYGDYIIVHYDGNKWKIINIENKSDSTNNISAPYDFIHCTASNNLWIGKGSNLIYYNENKWEVIHLKEVENKINLSEYIEHKSSMVENSKGEIYFSISINYNNGNSYSFLYKKQQNNWQLVKQDPFIYDRIYLTNSGKLYCYISEQGLMILKNKEWDYLFTMSEQEKIYKCKYHITQDNEIFKSYFIYSGWRKLYYYDSKDWISIVELFGFQDIFLLKIEKEYFIVSNDLIYNTVFHGK